MQSVKQDRLTQYISTDRFDTETLFYYISSSDGFSELIELQLEVQEWQPTTLANLEDTMRRLVSTRIAHGCAKYEATHLSIPASALTSGRPLSP